MRESVQSPLLLFVMFENVEAWTPRILLINRNFTFMYEYASESLRFRHPIEVKFYMFM